MIIQKELLYLYIQTLKKHKMKNRDNLKMVYKLSNNKRRLLFEENNKQSWLILDLSNSKDYCHYQYYKRGYNK